MTTTVPSARAESGSSPDWALLPAPGTPQGWIDRAREVAAVLSTDAAERDRRNETPYAEIAQLKNSGLVSLLCPAELGGAGLEWPTAYQVVREVAAADGSIGQLLGDHYLASWMPRFVGTPVQIERIESAGDQAFFGAALNPGGTEMVARDDGDCLVFNGRQNFCRGVKVSDFFLVEGLLEGSDQHVIGVVRTDQPGVIHHNDWENMGQRLTECGGVTVSDVRVPWTDALGAVDKAVHHGLYATMAVPTDQLVSANVWLGIARGALAQAAEYARHEPGWFGHERAADEERVLDAIGDLTAKLWAAEALAEHVAEEGLALHRDPDSVTEGIRDEHKVRTAAVRARADEVALEITTRVFEVTGVRSTAAVFGFDRFWRNVRTHTLHQPVAYQRREIGRYQLRRLDAVPEPGRYC